MDARKYLVKKYGWGGKVKVPRTRNGFYPLFSEFEFTCGCEVGVYLGENAQEILLNNPTIKLYLVDAYDRKQYSVNTNYKYKAEEAKVKAKKRIKKIHWKYGVEYQFIRKLSVEAVKEFRDESLDFVYIDANHSYEHVIEDLTIWSQKVRVGGIIGGHDYDRYKTTHFEGVIKAVNEFIKKHRIRPVYLTLDSPASYFWVKRRSYA